MHLKTLRAPRPRKLRAAVAALIVLSLLIVLPAPRAQARTGDTERRTLPNGLTVVLQEDHSAPVVAVQVWVKAGSRYETDREAGITHLIEHMIFKGTERRGPGQVAREIEASGGNINAYTSFDQTVYHVVLPSRHLGLGLDVLSDAVGHSLFDPAELEREKAVVIEEIRQRDDQPQVRLSKALFRAAYEVHPYRRPVIGFEETVASFSRADVMAYLAKWYWPGNLTLVVAGDIDPKQAWPLIEKTFGQASYPGDGVSEADLAPEPPQRQPRLVSLGGDVQEAYLDLAFHIPGVAHDDSYALDVLAEVLGEGASSRLYQKVKQEKELVYSVEASAFTPLDPGLFFISASLSPAKTQEALGALLEETWRLRHEGPTAAELAKARLNIEAGFVRGRATAEGRARELGYFEAIMGDWRLSQEYLARIGAVSAEDVRRVAAAYLRPENMTVALLAPAGQEGALSDKAVLAAAKRAAEAAAPTTPAKRGGEGPATAARYVLPNGMRLIVKQNPGSGTVAVQAAVLGGQRYEPAGQAGVANFAAAMLTKGAAGRSAVQIARLTDSMAAGLSGFSGRNSMGLTGDFLAERFGEGMALFADVLRRPDFPAAEVEKMRVVLLAAIKSRQDELSAVAFDLFNAALHGPHPYSRTLLGTPESVQTLKPSDLKEFWGRYVQPQAMVLTVVGDIDPAEARLQVEELFGDWQGEPAPTPPIPAQEPPREVTRVAKERGERNQVHMIIGFPGTTITSPDRFALDVLDAALSSQGGRLFVRLRDELSLAYSVSAFSQEGLEPGSFAVYIATSPDKRAQALEELMAQLRLARGGLTPAELERAKRYLVGSYEIGLQSNSAQATQMGLDELYGLGYNYGPRYVAAIEGVKAKDVAQVAQQYIKLDQYLQAEVGRLATATGLPGEGAAPAGGR